MKTFKVTFYGRTKNALGIRYNITDTVQAEKIEDVRLALYDKYEHICNLKIEEVQDKPQ